LSADFGIERSGPEIVVQYLMLVPRRDFDVRQVFTGDFHWNVFLNLRELRVTHELFPNTTSTFRI
jgi:hypothetical protein